MSSNRVERPPKDSLTIVAALWLADHGQRSEKAEWLADTLGQWEAYTAQLEADLREARGLLHRVNRAYKRCSHARGSGIQGEVDAFLADSPQQTEEQTCVWDRITDTTFYKASCDGFKQTLNAPIGTYCPYCGKRIEIKEESR